MLEQFPSMFDLQGEAMLTRVMSRLKRRLTEFRSSKIVFVLNEELWLMSEVKRGMERVHLVGESSYAG